MFGTLGSLVLVHAMLSLPFCIVLLSAGLVSVNRTLAALSTILIALTALIVIVGLRFVRGAELARLVARR